MQTEIAKKELMEFQRKLKEVKKEIQEAKTENVKVNQEAEIANKRKSWKSRQH